MKKPEKEQNRQNPPPVQAPSRSIFWFLALTLLLLWMWQETFSQLAVQTIPYSTFKEQLASGNVIEAAVREDEIIGKIRGQPPAASSSEQNTPKPLTTENKKPSLIPQPPSPASEAPPAVKNEYLFRTVRVEDPKLVEELEAAGIQYSGVRPRFISQLLLWWILPLLLMIFIWSFVFRRIGNAGQSLIGIGKSKARLLMDKDTGVKFTDVAGCEEAKFELQELVDFLKNPRRYQSLGAKIPKGVLLVGPPGTGKTLLARAVAGEARVPFFSISGSEFVEMFVGVGAARVRDLFQQAKAQAPCIVFVDELDAIGRQRGVHMGPVNDEREQTLNQLLVDMDGFEANAGVIVLSATNRPEVLDKALLRPGRFDRQVVVDSPDLDGRHAILKVHARHKPIADTVDLRKIAQGTVGFSGADLANVINEAALLAARRNGKQITQVDLDEAVEKVVAGPERKSRRLREEEKRRVAYHEVGHALVAAYSEHVDPVHKISIVPRGRAALGYTLQIPAEDQFLMTEAEIHDRIRGLVGGRAAEEVVFGDVTTGAQNDLERATAMARQMVCVFGMNEVVGLAQWARRDDGSYLTGNNGHFLRDCSEETARKVDEEVRKILDQAYHEAREILIQHRSELELVTSELLKVESIDAATFNHLIGRAHKPEAKPLAPPDVWTEPAAVPNPLAEVNEDKD